MAEGDKTYKGLAVPLWGPFEARNTSTTLDHVTLTAASGGSGDFLVCQSSGGGEVFVVSDAGDVTAAGKLTVTGNKIFMGTTATTAPTTGLVKGDVVVVWDSATHPVLGMCISTATQLVVYTYGFNAGTLGLEAT